MRVTGGLLNTGTGPLEQTHLQWHQPSKPLMRHQGADQLSGTAPQARHSVAAAATAWSPMGCHVLQTCSTAALKHRSEHLRLQSQPIVECCFISKCVALAFKCHAASCCAVLCHCLLCPTDQVHAGLWPCHGRPPDSQACGSIPGPIPEGHTGQPAGLAQQVRPCGCTVYTVHDTASTTSVDSG
jgi:hypothetical protein